MIDHKNEDCLFREGDWKLCSIRNFTTASQIRHWCEGFWWYVYSVNEGCSRCKKVPPTEMIGLKHLYNWDR